MKTNKHHHQQNPSTWLHQRRKVYSLVQPGSASTVSERDPGFRHQIRMRTLRNSFICVVKSKSMSNEGNGKDGLLSPNWIFIIHSNSFHISIVLNVFVTLMGIVVMAKCCCSKAFLDEQSFDLGGKAHCPNLRDGVCFLIGCMMYEFFLSSRS